MKSFVMLALLLGIAAPAIAQQDDPARAADTGAPGQQQNPAGTGTRAPGADAADTGAPGQHQDADGTGTPAPGARAADSGAPGQRKVDGEPARRRARPAPRETEPDRPREATGSEARRARSEDVEVDDPVLLERYDANGDGMLDEEERQAGERVEEERPAVEPGPARRDEAPREETEGQSAPSHDLEGPSADEPERAPPRGADEDDEPGGTTGPGTSDPSGGAGPR